MLKRSTVFVVDDDASVCTALGRLMKSAGLNVKTFTSAKDFLSEGCHQSPGCLLLDVRMPDLGGLELQRIMIEAGSQMPVIFMSAHEDAQDRRRAMRAGAAAFLQKPFDDDVLVGKVRQLLMGSREQG